MNKVIVLISGLIIILVSFENFFEFLMKIIAAPKKFIEPNSKKNAKPKRRLPLRKKKSPTFITSMFSTHRDRAPAGAFAKLNNA